MDTYYANFHAFTSWCTIFNIFFTYLLYYFVSIGKSSWKDFQADRIRAVTTSIHTPACPVTSPRWQNSLIVSSSSPSIVIHIRKGSSAFATVNQVLEMKSLQFLKLFLIPEHRLCIHFLQLKRTIEFVPTPFQHPKPAQYLFQAYTSLVIPFKNYAKVGIKIFGSFLILLDFFTFFHTCFIWDYRLAKFLLP